MAVAKFKGKKNVKPAVTEPQMPAMLNPDGSLSAKGIMGRYDFLMNKANQANEARYGDILGQYGQRFDRNMGMLEGVGAQAKADINDSSNAQRASMMQRLTDLGMSNTTIAPTMAMGVERERVANQNRLADQLATQKLSADASLSKDKLDFMERREDVGPDLGMYAQLMMDAANGPGGGGGLGGPGFGGEFGGGPGGGGPLTPAQKADLAYAGTKQGTGHWGYGASGTSSVMGTRPLTPFERMQVIQGNTGGVVGGAMFKPRFQTTEIVGYGRGGGNTMSQRRAGNEARVDSMRGPETKAYNTIEQPVATPKKPKTVTPNTGAQLAGANTAAATAAAGAAGMGIMGPMGMAPNFMGAALSQQKPTKSLPSGMTPLQAFLKRQGVAGR